MGFQAAMSEREQFASSCMRAFPCQGKRHYLHVHLTAMAEKKEEISIYKNYFLREVWTTF